MVVLMCIYDGLSGSSLFTLFLSFMCLLQTCSSLWMSFSFLLVYSLFLSHISLDICYLWLYLTQSWMLLHTLLDSVVACDSGLMSQICSVLDGVFFFWSCKVWGFFFLHSLTIFLLPYALIIYPHVHFLHIIFHMCLEAVFFQDLYLTAMRAGCCMVHLLFSALFAHFVWSLYFRMHNYVMTNKTVSWSSTVYSFSLFFPSAVCFLSSSQLAGEGVGTSCPDWWKIFSQLWGPFRPPS